MLNKIFCAAILMVLATVQLGFCEIKDQRIQELVKEFEPQIASWKLIPGGGGAFEVKVGDKLVYSKLETGQFPDPRDILKKLQKL